MVDALQTTCCIVGGGPGGMMLGLLLARAGVDVIVLEKHKNFLRDFRGDTIHPATLQLMHELGWLDDLLKVHHTKIEKLSVSLGGSVYQLPDFTHLPTAAKFIALMPQWDFLNFIAAKAAAFPSFHLLMEHEVTGLIEAAPRHRGDKSRIVGVQVQTPNGPLEIHAPLTVGCDGRRATTVAAAHLDIIERGVPIGVLWFNISRRPTDPENALGYINHGRVAILIDRSDYFQVGYIIRKDAFPAIQSAGLDAFRTHLGELVPFLTEPDATGHCRIDEITDFDQLKLLAVQINHLHRWHMPGLLCIGDAAHAMSPVGGIGINLAIQDAVATANLLSGPLSLATMSRPVPDATLALVQHRRQLPTLVTQWFQVQAHRILTGALGVDREMRAPFWLRYLSSKLWARRVLGRAIGLGALPEHIHSPKA
jgi:2-polyprenyl-6-methoxyphenol hydroxylase-like FAD-dependent oxidoreductase